MGYWRWKGPLKNISWKLCAFFFRREAEFAAWN
jgi:hypothetical protein